MKTSAASRLPRACRAVTLAMADTPHIEPRLRELLRASKRRNAPRVLPTLTAFTMAAIVLAGVQADERRPAQVIEPQAPMVTKLEIPSMVPDGVRADGMRIDIFAIGTEDGRRWWKPDGRPMEPQKSKEPFVHMPEVFTQPKWLRSSNRSPGVECRHLIFRFQQTAQVRPDIHMTSKAARRAGDITTWYTHATVPVSKAAKFHNVLWHIPNGPWKEQAVWRIGDPSRRDYPKFVRGRLSRVFPEPVVFFGPQPAREATQKLFKVITEVWVQDRLGEEEMRVTFRDRAGGELRMTECSFDALRGRTRDRVTLFMGETVEPQEIASISFESRPYRIFNLPAFPTIPPSR